LVICDNIAITILKQLKMAKKKRVAKKRNLKGNVANLSTLIKEHFGSQRAFHNTVTSIKEPRISDILMLKGLITDEEFDTTLKAFEKIRGAEALLHAWRKAAKNAYFRRKNKARKKGVRTRKPGGGRKAKNAPDADQPLVKPRAIKKAELLAFNEEDSITAEGMERFTKLSKKYGKKIPADLAFMLIIEFSE
jgi:hypothetical protein